MEKQTEIEGVKGQLINGEIYLLLSDVNKEIKKIEDKAKKGMIKIEDVNKIIDELMKKKTITKRQLYDLKQSLKNQEKQ